MRNITEESNNILEKQNNQMPTVKDFATAKINEGFSALGKSFGKGKKRVEINTEIKQNEMKLNILAKKIGNEVISQIGKEVKIEIPHDYIAETIKLKGKIKNLELELKNI